MSTSRERDARIASDVSPVGDGGMGDYNWTVSDSDNHLVTCLYHPHSPPSQQGETRNGLLSDLKSIKILNSNVSIISKLN